MNLSYDVLDIDNKGFFNVYSANELYFGIYNYEKSKL